MSLQEYFYEMNGFSKGLTIKNESEIVDWPDDWGEVPDEEEIKVLREKSYIFESWKKVRKLQREMIVKYSDILEIHEREKAHEGTKEEDYTLGEAGYQALLSYFQVIRSNDDKKHSTPEEAFDALGSLEAPF